MNYPVPPPVWRVWTRDRKDGEPYKVGGDFESLDVARYFVKACLRSRHQRYAEIVRYETVLGTPVTFDHL